MANYDYSSGGFPTSPATNDTLTMNGTSYTYDGSGWKVTGATAQEGTAILSTGETGGTKYLREDGDGTSSWQAVAGGGIGEFISTSIAISSDDTALANDDESTNYNIGIGKNAGLGVSTAANTISIGQNAGKSHNSANNIAIGFEAFMSGTGGTNTAVGGYAMGGSSNGAGKCAFGYKALGQGTSGGAYSIGIGSYAGKQVSGADTIAIGYYTMGNSSDVSGTNNIAIGRESGYVLTTGQYNFLGGYQAGYSATSASYNTFIGYQAGKTASNSNQSVYIGYRAGVAHNATEGVMVGSDAGYNTGTRTGTGNTFLGYRAGMFCEQASKNVCLGYQAGYADTSSNQLHIANNSTESLIEGDFSAKTVNINGALTVNGTAVGGGGGGAMEFVSQTTVSSSTASVAFTNLNSSSYDRYVLHVEADMQTSSHLMLRMSSNNGTSYDSSSNYYTEGQQNGSTMGQTGVGQGYIAYSSGDTHHATLTMIPSSGVILVNSYAQRPAYPTHNSCATVAIDHATQTTFNAIQILNTSGWNITSGVFTLYGIKDS
jgi:hypothetical protein